VQDARAIPCVIYAAKSTEDRRGSIPGQLAECREAIEADPLRTLIGEYSDEAYSGFKGDRGPGLAAAIEHAEDLVARHGGAELWAQHSDRLARGDGKRARHTVELALWALKHEVAIRTLQDPETFRDLLYAVITGQRNHEDSTRKGLATQAGVRRAVARGQHTGPLPDGYRHARHLTATGEIERRGEIDPERQRVLALIFRLALRGRTCGQIAASLTRRGWLTKPVRRADRPRPFDVGHVYDTLTNPTYAALATYRGQVLAPGNWPAYITPRQHARILARLASPQPGNHHAPPAPHLLAGIGRCGHCGAPLRIHTSRTRRGAPSRRSYSCASHINERAFAQCHARPIDAQTIGEMLTSNLPALLGSEPPASTSRGRPALRARLRAAALAGDERQLDEAIDAVVAGRRVEGARSGAPSPTRELFDAVEAWTAQEPLEHPDGEVAHLNALVRDQFSQIAVRVDPDMVTLAATHRRPGQEIAAVRVNRTAWVRSTPAGQRRTITYGGWAQSEILGALQAWSGAHGHSPSTVEWKHAGTNHPATITVLKMFAGDWNGALRAAGLDYVKVRRHHWSEKEMLAALCAWAKANGRAPRRIDWRWAGEGHPCTETVVGNYGSWVAALKAAGLTPTMRP